MVMSLFVFLFASCDLNDDSSGSVVAEYVEDNSSKSATDDDVISLLSSTGGDVLSSTINMWSTKTSFTATIDENMGTVLEVYTDATSEQSGEWGTVLAFSDIDDTVDFMSLYGELTFKIKSDDFTSIILKIPDSEEEYTIADGESLGNGWYKITASLSDFISANEQSIAFFQYTSVGEGSFFITDIEFSGEAVEVETLPEDGGYLYSPDNTQSIFFSDLSPWDAGSSIEEIIDTTYGTSLSVSGGSNWGDVQCLSFLGVGQLQEGVYYEAYDTLKFKINVDTTVVTEVKVYCKGTTTVFDLTTDATSLGDDWYEMTVTFADIAENSDDGQIAFLVSAAFYITDVELY